MEEFQTIRSIFDEALEMPDTTGRQAFLEKACAGSLRIKTEVEELLMAHDRAGEVKLFQGEVRSAQPTLELWHENWEGRRFGPYTVLDKLGEGGVGIVYLAEQSVPVRRRVALKLIKPGMDSRSVLARFELERKVLERMDHPNIAKVLDAGITPQGRPYFVMEWVKGERITDFCNSRNLSVAERLRLIVQVCHAVQHAHQKGIIHRDLKPSNILVVSVDDSHPLPKVIDFGIAKATSEEGNEGGYHTLTASNPALDGVLGTPAYMSPEQASEGRPDLDTRTDVYSLGVLLYELVAGQPPFATPWLLSGGLAAMRKRILEVEPPRPSSSLVALEAANLEVVAAERGETPDRLVSAVRGDLDWIVLKAMAKQRQHRYPTANSLAQDLDRHLAHQPVEARPPTSGYLFGRFIRRNRLMVGFLATVGLIFICGLAVSGWQWRRALRAEHLQRLLRQEAEQAQHQTLFRAYSADMKVASVALEAGNVGQAMNLLDRYLPAGNSRSNPPSGDVRGFEWYYLHHLAHGREISSFSHQRMVACVRSPGNNEWIAASSSPGDVRVWDRSSGLLLHSFPALEHQSTRSSLDLSSDGQLLVYLTETAAIVRDTTTWMEVCSYPGNWKGVCFSPVGHRFALLGLTAIRVVDADSIDSVLSIPLPEPLRKNQGDVSFCGKQSEWLAVMHAGNLWILEADTGFVVWKPNLGDSSLLTALATSRDGRLVAVGDSAGRLKTLDLERRELVQSVDAHAGWLMGVAFSNSGERIATGGGDQTLRVWPIDPRGRVGEIEATLRGHLNEVWAVVFSADDEHLISGGKDTLVKWWSATNPDPPHTDLLSPPLGMMAGFSGDGRYYRVVDANQVLHWLPVQPGAEPLKPLPLRILLNHEDVTPWRLAIGEDSLTALRRNGVLETRGLPDGEVRKQVKMNGITNSVLASLSADQRWLVDLEYNSITASLWDTESGERRATLPAYVDNESVPRRCRLAFSSDGRWLAYAVRNFGIGIWDLKSNRIGATLQGHAWQLYCLAFSPDSTRLASSSWDGSVMIWDVATWGLAMPPLRGHFAGVMAVSFVPDGRTLVTQGGEGVLKFWNVVTGTEVHSVPSASTQWACPVSADLRQSAWLDKATGKLRLTPLDRLGTRAEPDFLNLQK
jgi:serine/threonine protein kinase